MASKKPRTFRKVDIEIPIYVKKKYVPGSGPPSAPLTLLPRRDSTGYIIDQFILPPEKDVRKDTRRLLYYHIGFTDLPTVKLTIPGHQILDYVSPRELEDWEYNDFERRTKEKERQATLAPPKKKNGRPKKQPEEASPSQAASAVEDAMLLAKQVAGPSLSTPQKRKFKSLLTEEEGGETSNLDSDDAIRQQLQGDDSDGSALEEFEFEEGIDLANEPTGRIPSGMTKRRIGTESLSRSSMKLLPSEIPKQTPLAASPLAFDGRKPSLPVSTSSIHPQLSAPTPGMLHPAWLQTVGKQNKRAGSAPVPMQKNGSIQRNGVTIRKETPIKPPLPPNFQAILKQPTPSSGFTPAGSAGVHHHSSPARPMSAPTVATSPSNGSKPSGIQKRQTTGKTPAKAKEPKKKAPKEKQSKKGKAKAQVEEDEHDFDGDIAEDEWRVKELLDDRYVYEKGRKVHMYLVNWEGDWPPEQNPTWEPADNIQDDNLVTEYRRRKKAGLLKPDKHQKTLMTFFNKPRYSNVAEAFEADLDDQEKPHTGIESDSDEPDELLVTETSTNSPANGNHGTPTFSSFDTKLAKYHQHFRGSA